MITDQELLAEEQEEEEAEESLEQLEAKRDGEAADREIDQEEPLAEAHYLEVVAQVEAILAGQRVDESRLATFSDDEREAILFFRQIVDGRTAGNEFMYAEKRLEGLNLVLATLQPILSVGAAHQVLNASLMQVVDDIEALRQKLVGLEDAQDDELPVREEKAVVADADVDDKPAEKPGETPADKADKAKADKAAKAETDDDLDAERRIRKAASTLTEASPGGVDPVDDGTPRKSTVWDPDDRGDGPA